MSSSTSSSELVDGGSVASGPVAGRAAAEGAAARAGARWWLYLRTPAFVLAVLLLVEVGVRVTEERLSLDVEHIHEMGDIVRDLADAPGPSVLFIGNSLTRRGVDVDLMRAGLDEDGAGDWNVAALYPDDTAVLDWVYLYDRYVIGQDAVPDVVVVGFGNWHLEDRPISRAQSYRLGRYFASDRMLGYLVGTELTSLADKINVLLSHYSAAFANRERISRRVLSLLPGYEESARRINDLLKGSEDVAEAPATYERLERLVKEVEGSGAELVLTAMPTRSGYDLDPQLVKVAEEAGARVIDLRDVPGLTTEMFEDPLHLGPEGAALYTSYAAEALAPLLSRSAAVQ
ncbi:MAG TPA: hypothetical protein VF202_00115 [Trueperaceae bacterium]